MTMKKYALLNEIGIPTAFYSSEIHGENMPDGVVEITHEQWREFLEFPFNRKMENGEVVEYASPVPAPTVTDYENAIQALIEETAQSRQFRDAVTLASYTASTAPAWAAQAQTFVAWRDAVWQYTYQQYEQFQLGLLEQPSVAEFLSGLPVIDWNEQ